MHVVVHLEIRVREACGLVVVSVRAPEDGPDRRLSAGRRIEADPVADRRQVGLVAGVVQQLPGQAGADLAVRDEDVVGAAVLHRDAAGDEPGGFVLLEFLFEIGSPAEPGEPEDRSGLRQRETPLLSLMGAERARGAS